ncbi:MAG: pyridoxal-phosphate dependent enzyme [Bacteroidota bacterium]|nr:pyridoxal-phosphate dependent enzyme [Bacteroidota bacterium]
MSNYYYECSSCGMQFTANEIEDDLHYLCPLCGKAEKNKPLTGVLKVLYDYKSISKELRKDDFLNLVPGKFWTYPQLLPLVYNTKGSSRSLKGISESKLNYVRTSSEPVLKCNFNGNELLVFDDTANPTLSYKDRASVLVAAKAIQLGIKEISAASTGNAGSSLAGICARLGLKSHIFVPEKIPLGKRMQIQAFGAELYLVKSDYDHVFDLCLDVSIAKGWYNRNTAYNPLTIEGKKSSVFDMFINLGGKLPEYIIVSVGDGVIISGIYKGLFELKQLGWIKKMPKLIAVQAKGSNALVRYLKNKKFSYKPAETIADSINAGAPRNLYMAAEAVENSGGLAIEVSDAEILNAQKKSAVELGLLVEPAASASFAGYLKLLKEGVINPKSKVILMFTGNGLKDPGSVSKWNVEPKALSPEQWASKLIED